MNAVNLRRSSSWRPDRWAAASVLSASVVLLGGAQPAHASEQSRRVCARACVVMPTGEVLAHQGSAVAPREHERFEFSRRDRAVGVVRSLPLNAVRQWPEAPKPTERRIIFEQWRQ